MLRLTLPKLAQAPVMPRQIRSRPLQIMILLAAIVVVGAVMYGEATLNGNPVIGGFVVVIVLLVTWLLPPALAYPVDAAALVVPVVAVITLGTDPLASAFEFIAILVAVVLSALAVNGLMVREEQQRQHALELERFAADSAHELRTPLTALRSHLETTLRRPRPVDELTGTLHEALRQTERIIRVSESLMTLARSDAGVLALHRSDVDLADLIEEACSRWSRHAEACGVQLGQLVDGTGSVSADPVLIGRVIDNLLDNAFRHTPQGGQVTLGLTTVRPWYVMSVGDTGPGIPEQLRPRMFERFTRGDRAAGPGAGLGLSLCRAILAAHGGDVLLDDAAVTGTRVLVRLPVADS